MAEGRSGQRSNPRKLARANEAKRHTEQMAARYGREIERSLAGVRRVEAPVRSEVEGCVPEVTVMAADAVAAILETGRGRAEFCDLAVLDFASFVNPGGGYIRGAWAQEEALCAESFLYNVLEKQGGLVRRESPTQHKLRAVPQPRPGGSQGALYPREAPRVRRRPCGRGAQRSSLPPGVPRQGRGARARHARENPLCARRGGRARA